MGNLATTLQKQGKKVLFAFEEAIGKKVIEIFWNFLILVADLHFHTRNSNM